MYRIFILLPLFFLYYNSYACICVGKKNYERDFENSDLVFIGRVIEVDSNTFEFEVLENLKAAGKTTYNGIYLSSCDVLPNKNEKWLVYANFNKEGYIYIGDCSSSRSFNNVISSSGYEFTPPPKHLDLSKEEFYLYIMLSINRELAEFNEEINTLRNKSHSANFIEMKSRMERNGTDADPIDFKFYLIVLLILLNTILLLNLKFRSK